MKAGAPPPIGFPLGARQRRHGQYHLRGSAAAIRAVCGRSHYDGSVTISDFIDLASNFNGNYSGGVLPISAADRKTLADFAAAAGGSSVPEPAAGWLVLLIGGLITRRGCNRCRHGSGCGRF